MSHYTDDLSVQAELDKERERSKTETATRDSKIAGLFDELAAAQAEMHDARAAVDQVRRRPKSKFYDTGHNLVLV